MRCGCRDSDDAAPEPSLRRGLKTERSTEARCEQTIRRTAERGSIAQDPATPPDAMCHLTAQVIDSARVQRHDRATMTAARGNRSARRRLPPALAAAGGEQEDPGAPGAPPAGRRGTLRSMAISIPHPRPGGHRPGTGLRDPVRGRHHAGSNGR